MENFIQVGAFYTRDGKTYVVTKYHPGEYVTKDADSGNWHDAVEYMGCDDREMTFVRSVADFEAKFERKD